MFSAIQSLFFGPATATSTAVAAPLNQDNINDAIIADFTGTPVQVDLAALDANLSGAREVQVELNSVVEQVAPMIVTSAAKIPLDGITSNEIQQAQIADGENVVPLFKSMHESRASAQQVAQQILKTEPTGQSILPHLANNVDFLTSAEKEQLEKIVQEQMVAVADAAAQRLDGIAELTPEQIQERENIKSFYKKQLFPPGAHPSCFADESGGVLPKQCKQDIGKSQFDFWAPKTTIDDPQLLVLPENAQFFRETGISAYPVQMGAKHEAKVKSMYAKRDQNRMTMDIQAAIRAQQLGTSACASEEEKPKGQPAAQAPAKKPAVFSAFEQAETALKSLESLVGKQEALNLIVSELSLFNGGSVPQMMYPGDGTVALKAGKPPIQVSMICPTTTTGEPLLIERQLHVRLFAIVFGISAIYNLAALAPRAHNIAGYGTPMEKIYAKRRNMPTATLSCPADKIPQVEAKVSVGHFVGGLIGGNVQLDGFKPLRTLAVSPDKKIHSTTVDLIRKQIGMLAANDFFRVQVKYANGNEMPVFTIEPLGLGVNRAHLIAENLHLRMEMVMPNSYRKTDAEDKLYAAMYAAEFEKTDVTDPVVERAFSRLGLPSLISESNNPGTWATEEEMLAAVGAVVDHANFPESIDSGNKMLTATEYLASQGTKMVSNNVAKEEITTGDQQIIYLPLDTLICDTDNRDMQGNQIWLACDGVLINGPLTNYKTNGIIYKWETPQTNSHVSQQ